MAPAASTHARVLTVLRAVTQNSGVQGVLDLTRSTGIPDSTVHRILQAGVETRTVDQVGRGRYRPGPAMIEMALQAMASAPAANNVQQMLDDLQRNSGGAVLLFTVTGFGGLRRLCTDYTFGDRDPETLRALTYQFGSMPRSLRAGASGRVILAHLPPHMQEAVLAEDSPQTPAPGAIRDETALLASLADIRRRGYAIGRQEALVGWDGIAAPIMWGSTVMGSLLLARPAEEMTGDLREAIRQTCDAARAMSLIAAGQMAA
ncbi:IclR family transcriptional regulator C-terminal domain-containing protein [Streptomyces sp. MJM8645]|uniref:IclR family transcriptional regulator n=1 Tax=Streptomycetaceae TaxID=2062 RepID=UPI0007AF4B0A|nr:IclR family transcriptional regulator C-terminal domain-containing protein [Streptomyces sp. MJM8645]